MFSRLPVVLSVLYFVLAACSAAPQATPVAPADAPTANAPSAIPPATNAPATVSANAPMLTPAFEFVWKLSTAEAPFLQAGVGDEDAQGNIYLLTSSDQVVVLDPEGQVVRTFGEHGSKEGQLILYDDVRTPLYPEDAVAGSDVAVGPDGTIYVAEGANFRVQAFDPEGKFLFTWGARGEGDGEFEVPWAIAADQQGNIYVGDFTGTIQKFDQNGKFLLRFGGGRGAGEGQFVGAVDDIEADNNGNVYAADRKSGRIQKFDEAGKFVTQWEQCRNAVLDIRGLAVDVPGNVYVATRSGHQICVFDADGKLVTTLGKQGLKDGELLFGDASADLVVGADGSVYVSDTAGERLQKFSPKK